nr:MAG TPA: hypothetical protein [Caudoviricetes sp.]DAX05741.1 MAG TPA: hypothetical protein [Bacteriophage sp.]
MHKFYNNYFLHNLFIVVILLFCHIYLRGEYHDNTRKNSYI